MGLLDGLFGRKKARAGLLDPTPGLAVGDEWRTSFPTMQQQQPAPAEKLSFLEGGKLTGKDALGLALGAIGDTFAQQSGGQAIMAPMVMKGIMGAREAKRAAESAAAKREQDNQDWLWRHDYERANPKSSTPYRWEANDGSLMELGADGQPAVRYKDPTPKMNFIPDTMGGGKWVALPGTGAAAQPGSAGALPTVSDEASYNSLPPGAQYRDPSGNLRTKGGGAGNGAGNFAPGYQAARPSSPGHDRLDQITVGTESNGRRYGANGQLLRSPAGALGEWQVMPATARDPGFGLRPADPRNPDDLARLGQEYRAKMRQRYNGDVARMWGAFNAGPGRVDGLLAKHGNDWLRHAPAETQNYVRTNLRKLGFR